MYQYHAVCKRVIDGDTAVFDIDLGFYMWIHDLHLRFYGINTPEKNEPGWAEAKQYVSSFLDIHPNVTVNIYKQDKYGRWLAEIVDPAGGTLNKQLVDSGLAKVYFP